MNSQQEASLYAVGGAALGSIFGPAGTAIGGYVGGLAGSLVSGKKAKKYMKRAAKVQQEREQNAQDAQYLAMVREARMARAGSLAASASYGIDTSSLATSALSSIGSQSQYSVQFTANDQRLVKKYNYYMKKAGQKAKAAQTAMAVGQLIGVSAGVYGAYSGAAAAAETSVDTTFGTGPFTPTQQAWVDSYYNRSFNDAFQSGLSNVSMLNKFMSPIYSGMSQYNRL